MKMTLQEVPWPRPELLAHLVSRAPHRLWLDSALASHPRARLSLLVTSPLAVLTLQEDGWGSLQQGEIRRPIEAPLAYLDKWLQDFRFFVGNGKGFCGGAVGFLGYEAYPFTSPLKPLHSASGLPPGYFLLVDTALLLDHGTSKAWVFSWGIEEDLERPNPTLAKERCGRMVQALSEDFQISDSQTKILSWEVEGEKTDYLSKIQKIKEAIFAGDCYQVNLAQKFKFQGQWDGAQLYLRLRQHSPAPQMAFMNLGQEQILSASPEILLSAEGDLIRSFPIKGTRPRGGDAAEDKRLRAELWNSEKDAAELLMIVDLVRNDLGKVCRFGSISVPSLKYLEELPQVHHLVACVEGRMREGGTALQALQALFPGGSITGAPKLKAMEWINSLEEKARGIYTGSIGFLSFQGDSNFNIAIRTAVLRDGVLEYFAGGGIVADSDPEAEYEETFHKARGLFQTLGLEGI